MSEEGRARASFKTLFIQQDVGTVSGKGDILQKHAN